MTAGMTVIDAHHHVWDLAVRDQDRITRERMAPLTRTFALGYLRPAARAAVRLRTSLAGTSARRVSPADTGVVLGDLMQPAGRGPVTGTAGGTSIVLSFPENEAQEASFIAETIHSLAQREGFKYHDFGVLVRTNGLTAAIEEAFLGEALGAPYLGYLERTKRLIPGIW